MKDSGKIADRLSELAGMAFSPADWEFIKREIADLQRILDELEEFARSTPWISQQIQPRGRWTRT